MNPVKSNKMTKTTCINNSRIKVCFLFVTVLLSAAVYNRSIPFRHLVAFPADAARTAAPSTVHKNRSEIPDIANIKIPLQFYSSPPKKAVPTGSKPFIIYEKCRGIPDAPEGTEWPEEEYLSDMEVSSILDIPDPTKSRLRLDGRRTVKIGDVVIIHIQLYNGRNEKRKQGGDLVRVWLKEDTKGAKSTAHVIDNKDGSYTAMVTALWKGRPEVQAAIISPREVIATQFKRRYICPPVLMNTAVFRHPFDKTVTEETPCNYDNFIPGYSDVCNLTQENYGRPWYCGKPRQKRLLCQDWTLASDVKLWDAGYEKQILSPMAQQLLDPKYTARKIQTNITLFVSKDDSGRSMIKPTLKCSQMRKTVTWEYTSPTGYFYNKKWINIHCKSNFSPARLKSCLKNTSVILIGDSTTRQLFENIQKRIPCEWMTDSVSLFGKHRPGICSNAQMNYSLHWKAHSLPFCTVNHPRAYFKSIEAYLNEIQGSGRFVIVIHLFSHFLMYHSHVFYESLKDLKKGIARLLDRNLNVSIVIKGPHAYSFAKISNQMLWKPDAYANEYQRMIYHELKDFRDKVIYLECLDMTVCTEESHIHPVTYVVDALVESVFSLTCS